MIIKLQKMTIQNDSSIITIIKSAKYFLYLLSIAWIMTHGSRLIWLVKPSLPYQYEVLFMTHIYLIKNTVFAAMKQVEVSVT